MDWDMFKRNARHRFLRNELAYSYHWVSAFGACRSFKNPPAEACTNCRSITQRSWRIHSCASLGFCISYHTSIFDWKASSLGLSRLLAAGFGM